MIFDFEMAYLLANEDWMFFDMCIFFNGSDSKSINSLKFSSFTHQQLYADANKANSTVISYYEGSDRNHSAQKNLMRRETRRLSNEKPESIPGEADVLFSNVIQLHLSYFDVRDNEWKPTWNTQGVEGSANRLPDRVRISLTFPDEVGKEVTLTTQAKIHMNEVVQSFAN